MEKLIERKFLEDCSPDDLVDTGNPVLDNEFVATWYKVADLILKGVPESVVVAMLQALIERSNVAATNEIELILGQTDADQTIEDPTQIERPHSDFDMADCVLAAIWKGALLLNKKGNETISLAQLRALLKLGAKAAEKEHNKIVDEECSAAAKEYTTAVWANSYCSPGLD